MPESPHEFLDETERETAILNFRAKIGKGGFLRPALVSHMRRIFDLDGAAIERAIDNWSTKED